MTRRHTLRHSAYLGWRKHLDVSVVEVTRALDGLEADGVVPPTSSARTNPGEHGQDDLFAALNARSAVAFVVPAILARPRRARRAVFAADFLLDTPTHTTGPGRFCGCWPTERG